MNDFETEHVLNSHVLVQEKFDGLNIGVEIKNNKFILINKDKVIDDRYYSSYKAVTSILSTPVIDYIRSSNIAIFGEYIKNRYGFDEWIVFDIFDKGNLKFIKHDDILTHANFIKLSTAPIIYSGTLKSLENVRALITESAYSNSTMEGIIIKIEDSVFLRERYKYVRENFVK